MKNINSFIIGKVSKTHSFKGELLISCEYKELIDIIEEKEQAMFIYINEKPVPFFIENIRQVGLHNLIVKFEDIDNELQGRKYIGFKIGLDIKYLETIKTSKDGVVEADNLTGFNVIDNKFGMVGILKNIIEYPQQLIMEITHDEQNILIPYNEEFVLNIDYDSKTILVACPEGLIDLYLNKV